MEACRDSQSLEWDLAEVEQTAEWSRDHEAERGFQQEKQLKLRLEAMEYGTLAMSDDIKDEAEKRKQMDTENDKKLIADRRKKERASARTKLELDWDSWSGKVCWLEMKSNELTSKLEEHGLLLTEDRWQADIFVCEDAAEPPERVRWLTALLGKILVDSSAVKGKGGLLLIFKPACKEKMQLHITKNFQDSHSAMFDLIQRVLAKQLLLCVFLMIVACVFDMF